MLSDLPRLFLERNSALQIGRMPRIACQEVSEGCIRTFAATREQVSAILAALKNMPLERAAVAVVALTGVRPSEARGLRWEECDRAKGHVQVCRAVWHAIVGTTEDGAKRTVCHSDRWASRNPSYALEGEGFASWRVHPGWAEGSTDKPRQPSKAFDSGRAECLRHLQTASI